MNSWKYQISEEDVDVVLRERQRWSRLRWLGRIIWPRGALPARFAVYLLDVMMLSGVAWLILACVAGAKDSPLYFLVGGFPATVLLLLYRQITPAARRRAYAKYFANNFAAKLPQTLTLLETGVRVHSEAVTYEVDWPALAVLHELQTFLILEDDERQTQVIPFRAFESAAEREAFVGKVRDEINARPA